MPELSIADALQVALEHHRANRFLEASEIYQKILEHNPKEPDALHLLGMVVYQTGDPQKALTLVNQAIAERPDNPEYYNNLGEVYRSLKEIDQALSAFHRAILFDPDYATAHNNLAYSLISQKNYDEALNHAEKAVALKPDFVNAHINLGLIYQRTDRVEEAITQYYAAVEINPKDPRAHNNLGVIFQLQGKVKEAIKHYRKAVLHKPDYPEGHNNLGVMLQVQEEFEEAIDHYLKAIELMPTYAAAYNNLGVARLEQGDFEGAMAAHQKSIDLSPQYSEAYNNLGKALQDSGRLEESVEYYRKSLEFNPTDAHTHNNLGLALLALGNYEEGWPEYEWRLRRKQYNAPTFEKPEWQGEPIEGKTLFLWNEQGLGDSIQSIRLITLLKSYQCRLIVSCQETLSRLFQNIPGIDDLLLDRDVPEDYDVQLSLMSLPGLLKIRPETIPTKVPYLSLGEQPLPYLPEHPASQTDFLKVGVVWGSRSISATSRHRSCALELFSALFDLSEVAFYSLQMPLKEEEAEQLAAFPQVIDATRTIEDFYDTAAMVQQLDLVISADTSVAHLAGALGKPVWVMISCASDWRWRRTGETCIWYPTARLFRQAVLSEWKDVIQYMKSELKQLVESRV